MEPMEQEFANADVELQQLIWMSLDRCLEAGAREDDLQFLAWQTGCTDWKPSRQNSARG